MKRLIATVLAMLLCLSLSALLLYADPGSETNTDGSGAPADSTAVVIDGNYPPPPPGYEGIWPPPNYTTTLGDETGTEGDDNGWTDPHE